MTVIWRDRGTQVEYYNARTKEYSWGILLADIIISAEDGFVYSVKEIKEGAFADKVTRPIIEYQYWAEIFQIISMIKINKNSQMTIN